MIFTQRSACLRYNASNMRIAIAVLIGLSFFTGSLAHAQSPTSRPAVSGRLGTPIQLFNGKDLSGWIWFQPAPTTRSVAAPLASIGEVWTVKDGVLHCKGSPTGYIRTEREFENYILKLEQRHVARGNGGILFAITGADKLWPKSLEAQGQTDNTGDIRGIANWELTADQDRLENGRIRKIGPNSEKPTGQWDTIEVIVDGGQITITVNGQVQNAASTTQSLKGKIGLQSEGGEMEFRAIELTPIDRISDRPTPRAIPSLQPPAQPPRGGAVEDRLLLERPTTSESP
jgi:hypothetical protein